MKKFIITIFILLLIFISMYIYKVNQINLSKTSELTIDEVSQIETYLQKLYMWKEITNDALPTFDNINEAPDIWIWEVVKNNLEDYELSAEQLQNKAKEIFGENFKKTFPKNGYEYMEYNAETDKYYAIGNSLDNEEDSFLLEQIEKTENGYIVEIIEYLEDYSAGFNSSNKNYNIQIKNLNGDIIGNIENTENEITIHQFVKENINKFSRKKITLTKTENTRLIVQSISNIS